jgi:hypothetical protein
VFVWQGEENVGIHLSNKLVAFGFLLGCLISLFLVSLQPGITLSNDALDLEFSGLPLHTHLAF